MNSKLITPQRFLIALAIIALLILFRQCFKNRGTGDPEADQISIRYDAAVTNLNPYLTIIGTNLYTTARIFQTLGDLDPKSLELIPAIVEKIPAVRSVQEGRHKGELAYDFDILPEAMWDNGTPVTGKDMAFTLKIIFHPLVDSKAFASYFNDLSGVDIDPVNPKKFTVYFRKYYILALESMCQVPIMPSYNYDPMNHLTNVPIEDFLDSVKLKSIATDPAMKAFFEEFKQPKFANDPLSIAGSGPYRLETINDQGAILVKKDNWWGDKIASTHPVLAAYPKRLVYKLVKDENVVENMLKNGELDIVANSFSATKFLELKQKDSLAARYNFDLLPPIQYNRWLLNLNKPHLKDVRVRKALAYLVDYEHFIKNVRSNLAARTVSPILPAKRYYAKDLPLFNLDIEKAKALLAEAGWKDTDGDGFVDRMEDGKKVKFVLEILVSPIKINQMYAESVTETARLAGIEIKAVSTDLNEITPLTRDGNFETAFLGSALFSGLTDLTQRYHSKSLSPFGDNRSRYVNTTLDKIIEQIAGEPDQAKRDQLYLEAQKIIYEDLPEIFLLAPSQPIITSKKFEGVTTTGRPGYYEQMFKLK